MLHQVGTCCTRLEHAAPGWNMLHQVGTCCTTAWPLPVRFYAFNVWTLDLKALIEDRRVGGIRKPTGDFCIRELDCSFGFLQATHAKHS